MRFIKGIKVLQIWVLITVFLVTGLFAKNFGSIIQVHAKKNEKIITVVSLVRGNNNWVNKNVNWLQKQANAIVSQDLHSTWLLDFDALEDEEIINDLMILPERQEKGLLLEITPSLADQLNLPYDYLASAHEPQNVFLSGYSIDQRKIIIDHLFSVFNQKFSTWAKSVGAWFIDSWSLQYMRDTYQIEAALLVAEQYATDHHTIRGHVWQSPYYPSLRHSLIPAIQKDMIDIVVVQWAAREPLRGYGFHSKYSNFSVQANDYTKHGLDDDYFNKLLSAYLDNPHQEFNQLTVGIEVGQEGANYFLEFTKLLDKIDKRTDVTSSTMVEFAGQYKNRFSVNPELRFITWQTEEKEPSWAGWVSTNYYRAGVVANKDGVWIRDLRSFRDSQDDLYFVQDKRRELFRQTEAIIDEVGQANSWLLIKNPTSTVPLAEQKEETLELDFTGNKFIFNSDGFKTNFAPQKYLSKLKTSKEKEWYSYFPSGLSTDFPIVNKGWQVVFIVIVAAILPLLKFFKFKDLIPAIMISIVSLKILLTEILALTPFNDLGILYLTKIASEQWMEAFVSYILSPVLIAMTGMTIYCLVKKKLQSPMMGMLAEIGFYFGLSFGWFFPLYRRLPLDPGLITGVKLNIMNFSWFSRFFDFDRLAYVFSAGQMNIEALVDLISRANNQLILLVPPIVVYVFFHFGLSLIGLLYLLISWVRNKQFLRFIILFLLIIVSPFFINKLDIRFPSFTDYVINAIGVIGLFSLIGEKKNIHKKLRLLLVGIFIMSLIPGVISLVKRNEKLKIRSELNWSDRIKMVGLLNRQPKIQDVFLWQIKPFSQAIVFIPLEIEEHHFVDTHKIKKQLEVITENSYGILGKTKTNN